MNFTPNLTKFGFIETLLVVSEFINEVVKSWDAWLETLSLSDGFNDCVGFAAFFQGITSKFHPMIKDALWERSSCCRGSEGLSETEGLSDWKMAFHVHEWSSSNWLFTNDNTSSLSHGCVDSTNNVIRGLDFDQEDWLLQSWLTGELTSV